MRKAVFVLLLSLFLVGTVFAGGQQEQDAAKEGEAAEKMELEFVISETEYQQVVQDIWDLYTEENPNVEVQVVGWNEGQDAVYLARIAAGDPPHMWETAAFNPITKDRYDFLVNLLEVDYPYFDKVKYDVKERWSSIYGVDDYLPSLDVWMPVTRSFIYRKDVMAESGLNPKESVRDKEALMTFLYDLQDYVEQDEKLQYTLDAGWLANGWRVYLFCFTYMLHDLESQYAVWQGDIRWNDMKNSPYVDTLNFFKKLYDDGILPVKWWTRQWEHDYEAGYIAGKSNLAWHGPWLWDKTVVGDPDANLTGFPMPPNENGKILHDPISADGGVAIFKEWQNKPIFDEIVKAFNWYNSPEIIKLRSEATGKIPAFDMSDVGQPDIQNVQYQEFIKPFADGEFGDMEWDTRPWPDFKVAQYKVDGKADVLKDNTIAAHWGDFMMGKISTEEFLSIFQKRWEEAYEF